MTDSQLIELVHNHEELYNLHHRYYSNQQIRENIWEDIGEILGENGAVCKARWHKIRENYRKALILRKTRTGPAAEKIKIKPPKHHQELSFIIPYLNDEETRRSNIADISKASQDFNSTDYTSLIDSPSGGDSQFSDSTIKKRRYTTPFKSALVEQTQTQTKESESDTLTDFFMTMAKTVSKFPVSKQLKIKAQLFQLVHNVECEIAESISVPEETEVMLFAPPSQGVQVKNEIL